MHELILHLIGDYILQTEQMAVRKIKSWYWATLHALTYSLPFLVYLRAVNGDWGSGWAAWGVIFGTHAVIDRFRLATYVSHFKNLFWFGRDRPEWEAVSGYAKETPEHVRFWLVVIIDNTLHLAINHLALRYLNGW